MTSDTQLHARTQIAAILRIGVNGTGVNGVEVNRMEANGMEINRMEVNQNGVHGVEVSDLTQDRNVSSRMVGSVIPGYIRQRFVQLLENLERANIYVVEETQGYG